MGTRSSSRGTPATKLLVAAGIPHVLRAYQHDPRNTAYGPEAARALGVAPGLVFKTLLVDVDGSLVVAILPVDRRLDPGRLAAAVGGKRAAIAEPARAERATGYVVGGISPLGQRRAHPSVLDDCATSLATILVSAGRRGLDVELDPTDLIRLLQAKVAPISGRPTQPDRG